eukprot:CAMPEP_0118935246 /NCGR_PEP_ID=MMETSP1169-20130426/15259_1 /TAXON_ID=36882 /ORGANISM="Pyramimonas obovata, Strain CCMP722" /LENGTH=320 /DNA_ID=CAMNT_0006878255 /DNA_START=48 /DNA_END=1010 /DNA_ORIENTATION=+
MDGLNLIDPVDELIISGLAALGLFKIVCFALKVLVNFYKWFLRPSKNIAKLGKWAVVTGATDGIGKAYAFQFAKKGMNVLLISRTESKLVEVAKEIQEKYGSKGVKAEYVVCDYSKFDEAARAKVSAAVKPLEVGVLVNNVGVSYPYPKYFQNLTEEQVSNLMEMNVASTTWMTHMVLPQMVERKKGCIVNIASAAGVMTNPLLAQYSAAKAYVEKFSRGLNAELGGRVTVQCQVPFYVATKLAKMRKSMMVPTPDAYAKLGCGWIAQGEAVVQPFWLHALQGWVLELLPAWFVDPMVKKMHVGIMKRGMKKEAAAAKQQ